MVLIPQQLITSFKEFGLVESEAKIYSALVLFHDAEVKELQKLLDLSRPSIYEGLRELEELGLIVLINDKPVTYQAIPPEIALDMLMKVHVKAKENVLMHIRDLKKQGIADKSPSNLWYIFSSKTFGSKIKDMLENAEESVYCITSGQYIDLIEQYVKSNAGIELMVISEDKKIQKRLEKTLKNRQARIRTFKKEEMINLAAAVKIGNHPEKLQAMNQALSLFDFNNLFVMVTDDSEFFYIPPLPSDSLNAMTSKNKALILTLKLIISPLEDLQPMGQAPLKPVKGKVKKAS